MNKLQKHRISEDGLVLTSGNLEIRRYRTDVQTPYKEDGIWMMPSYINRNRTVIDDNEMTVCTFDTFLSDEEVEKYARIFAAGPKMLEALVACHDIMHDLVAENREDTSVGIVMDPEIDKAYLTLYAAIVQATNDPDYVKSFVLGHIQS